MGMNILPKIIGEKEGQKEVTFWLERNAGGVVLNAKTPNGRDQVLLRFEQHSIKAYEVCDCELLAALGCERGKSIVSTITTI